MILCKESFLMNVFVVLINAAVALFHFNSASTNNNTLQDIIIARSTRRINCSDQRQDPFLWKREQANRHPTQYMRV